MSHFRCHVSRVTCHLSRVKCCVSNVTFFFWQSGEAYRWRVCYQRGLPRLAVTQDLSEFKAGKSLVLIVTNSNCLHISIICSSIDGWVRKAQLRHSTLLPLDAVRTRWMMLSAGHLSDKINTPHKTILNDARVRSFSAHVINKCKSDISALNCITSKGCTKRLYCME